MLDINSNEQFNSPQIWIDQLLRLFHTGKFSEQIVKEQIETVIIAVSETTGLTISYAVLMCWMHPEIQERVFDEMKSVYDSSDEYSWYKYIQQFTYLDCMLEEVLRMFSVAPFIVRAYIANTKLKMCTLDDTKGRFPFVWLRTAILHSFAYNLTINDDRIDEVTFFELFSNDLYF